MKTKKKKTMISLREILLVILAMAWLIPILSLSIFIFQTYQKAYLEKNDKLVRNALEISGALLQTDIDAAITKLQKPTYEGEWESEYLRYKKGLISRSEYLTTIKASLISKYYMDNQVARYAFYLGEDEIPSCFSGKNGYGYSDYMKSANDNVNQFARQDSNYVEIHVIDSQIYLMRNLYTVKDYKKYGTLVLGLQVKELMEPLPLDFPKKVRLSFGDETEYISLVKKKEVENGDQEEEAIYQTLLERVHEHENPNLVGIIKYSTNQLTGYVYCSNADNYQMRLRYSIPSSELSAGLERLNILLFALVCGMLPFILITAYLITIHVNRPLANLEQTASSITREEFGSTIAEEEIRTRELRSLAHAFNTMSLQIKHLFDTVYLEQMATKDAQIEALQAQINPHFLNNTLEMMNWQARLNDDLETSHMIEALGTVLDAGINRSGDRTIRLAEELRCAEAFLYIMSMRFGSRLRVEQEIDPEVKMIQIPALILQPLLENAISHGIEAQGYGTILLRIFPDEARETVLIQIKNTSQKLENGQMERIRQIISGEFQMKSSEPGVHNSIGIYNVNRRTQLIYGQAYGLSVYLEEGWFVSEIRIPYPGKEQEALEAAYDPEGGMQG